MAPDLRPNVPARESPLPAHSRRSLPLRPFQDERSYEYDHVFGPKSEQVEVYERVGRGVVDAVLEGFHGTVLAYGISGSGKTHTTFGPAMIWHDWAASECVAAPRRARRRGAVHAGLPRPPGRAALPRACTTSGCGGTWASCPGPCASCLSGLRPAAPRRACRCAQPRVPSPCPRRGPPRVPPQHTVSITFVQLYMERIQDLLAAAAQGQPGPPLSVREDPRHGVYVAGATQLAASRWEDVLCAVASAVLERATSSTAQNRESSRSHAVLQVHVATTRAAQGSGPGAGDMRRVTRRTLTLVDLAGSERVSKSQAKVRVGGGMGMYAAGGSPAATPAAQGLRLEECKRINRSVAALGNCVAALTQPGSAAAKHVPFRDSTLTRLLTPSLGGEAVTRICASIGPAATHADETCAAAGVPPHAHTPPASRAAALTPALAHGGRYSTLQFARRAMRVQLRARAREEMQLAPRPAAAAGVVAPGGLSEEMRDVQEALAAARAAETGCDEEPAEEQAEWPGSGGSPLASKAARLRKLRRAGCNADGLASAPDGAAGEEVCPAHEPTQASLPPGQETSAGDSGDASPALGLAPTAAADAASRSEQGGAFSLKAAHDLQLALAAAQERERMARERAEREAHRSRLLEQEVADLREAQRRWEGEGEGRRRAPLPQPGRSTTNVAGTAVAVAPCAEKDAEPPQSGAQWNRPPSPPPTPPAPRMHLRAHVSSDRHELWQQQGSCPGSEDSGGQRDPARTQGEASTPAARGPSLATLVSPPEEGSERSQGPGGAARRINPLLGPACREAASASLSQSTGASAARSNPLLARSQEGAKGGRHALSTVSGNGQWPQAAGLSLPRDVFGPGERMHSPARL